MAEWWEYRWALIFLSCLGGNFPFLLFNNFKNCLQRWCLFSAPIMHTPLSWSLSHGADNAASELTWPVTDSTAHSTDVHRDPISCPAPCSPRVLSEHSLELWFCVSVSYGSSIGFCTVRTTYLIHLYVLCMQCLVRNITCAELDSI